MKNDKELQRNREVFLLKEYDQFAGLLTLTYDREERWLKFYLTVISTVGSLMAFLFSNKNLFSNKRPSLILGMNFQNVIGSVLMVLFLSGMLILFIHIRNRKNITAFQNALARIRRYFVDTFSTKEFHLHKYLQFRHVDDYKSLYLDSRAFFICLFIAILDSSLLLGSLYFWGLCIWHSVMISSFSSLCK
jgi:hypothetical protein